VGAATEVEMKEKKARVEDALHATRAARGRGHRPRRRRGAPAGRDAVAKVKGDNPARKPASRSCWRAIEQPMREIARNAGESRAWWVNKVLEARQLRLQRADRRVRRHGGDGRSRSTKVTRCALQNAASVAALMLTTDAMVAELPKEDKGNGRRHGRRAWAAWAAWATWTCKPGCTVAPERPASAAFPLLALRNTPRAKKAIMALGRGFPRAADPIAMQVIDLAPVIVLTAVGGVIAPWSRMPCILADLPRVVGAVASFLPGLQAVKLDPEVFLLLFIPPLLFATRACCRGATCCTS